MAKLYFKYGAMKSGKTTDLIKTWYNYTEKDLKVIIIKPSADKKAGDNIQSRAGAELKADYVVDSNVDIYKLINKHIVDVNNQLDCILIDEAQFLTASQVDDLGMIVDDLNIPIICYGLKADAFTHVFPGSLRLFEIADVIEELKAVCRCGSKATFNLRLDIVDGVERPVFLGPQIAIDGIDSRYDSVCRGCYRKLLKEQMGVINNEK